MSLTEERIREALDGVTEITHAAREGRRWGVTAREAALYDKGYDDALEHVRTALGIASRVAEPAAPTGEMRQRD